VLFRKRKNESAFASEWKGRVRERENSHLASTEGTFGAAEWSAVFWLPCLGSALNSPWGTRFPSCRALSIAAYPARFANGITFFALFVPLSFAYFLLIFCVFPFLILIRNLPDPSLFSTDITARFHNFWPADESSHARSFRKITSGHCSHACFVY
jgi:hypothetical protein